MVGVNQSAKKRTKLVAVNERGHVVGESHPRAVLSDHEVTLALQLRDEGYSLGWLARKFETSKSCMQHLCSGRNRSQLVARYARVSVRGKT